MPIVLQKSKAAGLRIFRETTKREATADLCILNRVDAASSQAIFDTDRVYFIRVDGNKMMVKSPGVIVPITGATSIVEFEACKGRLRGRRAPAGSLRPRQRAKNHSD